MIGLSNTPVPITQITGPLSTAPLGVPTGLNTNLYDPNALSFFTNQAQLGGGTLYYPDNTPKYIFTMTISQYTRTNLNSAGTFNAVPGYPGIVLPMPENMRDVDSVNWEDVPLGLFTGATLSSLGVGLGALGVATVGELGGQIGGLASGAISTAGALAGVAPNQFVTMLMHGPKYKRHSFNWTLAPQNFQEADQLRQIILTLRNAMAPGYTGVIAGTTPLLWTYPYVFYIRLYPNSQFLYKFKPCILAALHVDYTPTKKGAWLRQPTGVTGTTGQNPPAVMQVQMDLIEIEFWTQGNYDSSNNPDQSTTYGNATTLSPTAQNLINQATNAGQAVVNYFSGPSQGTVITNDPNATP